jgi:hypothetical protein
MVSTLAVPACCCCLLRQLLRCDWLAVSVPAAALCGVCMACGRPPHWSPACLVCLSTRSTLTLTAATVTGGALQALTWNIYLNNTDDRKVS